MNQFKFNGDWETEIQLDAFKVFQSRRGAYTSKDRDANSDGILGLVFEDDITEDPDPLASQIAAVNYIIEHQAEIVEQAKIKSKEYAESVIWEYGLGEEPEYQDMQIEKLIGFSCVRVLMVAHEDHAYYELEGGCDWDEEHGLAVLMHKSRVVKVGNIDGNGLWDALEDSGKENPHTEKTINPPKRHLPHPKYGKLKPSLEWENKSYVLRLIRDNHNDLFKKEVEEGLIDINEVHESWGNTNMQIACKFNNIELLKYLVEKGADKTGAIPSCNDMKLFSEGLDYLISQGGDINEAGGNGNTILHEIAQNLARDFDHRDFFTKDVERRNNCVKNIASQTQLAKELMEMGANPNIKNKYQFNCIEMGRNLNPETQKEFAVIFEDPKPDKKSWQFWK